MNVLAIAAHPDDLEIGCGASLYLHTKNGDDVHLLIATNGARSGNPNKRLIEQKRAAKHLGIGWANLKVIDTPPNGFLQTPCTFDTIQVVVKNVQPTIVYTHYVDDTHQEHRAVAQTTLAVARLRCVERVLMYESVTSINFNPTWYQNTSGVATIKKLEALAFHRSQVERWRQGDKDLLEIVTSMSTFRGSQIGTVHAEGFMLYRYVNYAF